MHVVATAGHVDHGKSTLVRALSGMEPDRWAEERRRGMTIDLGFAWTDVPLPGDGGATATVAFVDVPGHQRFLANMLAGVGPVPAVMLVVAADEGWARQTAEHVAALDALGVEHGVLAVTRSDLADPAAAIREVQDRLAGTSLAGIPAIAVSGTTGAGLDELRAALGSLVAGLPAPDTRGRIRLWVDRSFTVKGAGCVVTATLGAGTLRVGDELTLLPGGRVVGVRGLQSLGRSATSVTAVARVAVNLRGVSAGEVGRGDALVTSGGERLTSAVDAVRRRPGARAAGAPAPPAPAPPAPPAPGAPMTDLPETCVLHVGSAAVSVYVRPLGESAVRLTLQHPLPLRRGESAVLRDPGQQRIAAGVQIADVDPPGLGRRGAAAARANSLDAGISVHDEVRQRGAVTREQLALLGVLGRDSPLPNGLQTAGEVVVAAEDWTAWGERLEAAVRQAAADDPLAGGLSADAARRTATIPAAVPLGPLAASRGLVLAGGRLQLPAAGPVLPAPAAAALEKLRARLADSPFNAPEADDLPGLGLTPAVIGAASRAGLLLRLGPTPVLLLPEAEDEAVRRLRRLPHPFTASQARQALDTTRRVAIPLLEHLDGRRRTRRDPTGARSVLR